MGSKRLTPDATYAALVETGAGREPVTARELADQLDGEPETVVDNLEQLHENDKVENKELRGGDRVWWEIERTSSAETIDVTAFANLVAHELRNPLSIAIIHLQNLQGDESSYDEVETALDRMNDIIDVLIATANGSTETIDPIPVSVSQIAGEVRSTVGLTTDRLEVENDLVVETESHHLRYMLEHLCQNAVRHCDSDVRVSIGKLESESGFFVEDDGPGIAESEREQVFRPGYTTTEYEWGLGLTVVDQLAGVYDWDCAITTSTTGGTRVEFDNVAGLSTETATL
ncbi:sensor histidine kinase [Haladaptatus sp. NG-SE-30]